jgi:short-subunit dehydrogenase
MRVLLTGASSGIGFSLAKELTLKGACVLATARRLDRLEQLVEQTRHHPGKLNVLDGDLTSSAHRQRLAKWCQEHWGALDVLINNAGAGAIGPFEQASADRLRRVMEIDFFAPVELTRLSIGLLRAGNRPAILNIGSVLAHRAVPNKSEYCAAKFALRGWAESLRVELAGFGIEVLMLSPSTTRSEFFDSLVDTHSDNKSRSLGSMQGLDPIKTGYDFEFWWQSPGDHGSLIPKTHRPALGKNIRRFQTDPIIGSISLLFLKSAPPRRLEP